MRIKVLGCSGGIGPGLRTTSLLVDDRILVDAGTGVGDLTLDQLRRIGDVFLTHSHLDHVCGLAFMADNLFCGNPAPLRVRLTAATLDALRRHLFNWVIWPDFSDLPGGIPPVLEFEVIEPGVVQAAPGDLRVTAFDVNHAVPAVGYSLEGATGTFAFSGDTRRSDSLWAALNALPRLDLLMIEVAFADEQAEIGRVAGHYTPAQLGHDLARLRHRPELLLTHHKPGAEDVIEAQCRRSLAGWRYRHLRSGDEFVL